MVHIPPEIAAIKPSVAFLQFLIPAAASLLGGLFHHKSKDTSASSSNGTPQGATIKDLLPMLLPILQQAQQASQQNYQMQMTRYNQADPLRQSLLQMSANLMPNNVRPVMPLSLPQMPSSAPPQNQAVPRRPPYGGQ